MARRGLLNDAERTRLFEVPGDDTSLIRLYSLSDADRDFVLSKRGARNQLGMAVQIGLLRYPGFGLRLETGPSAALIQFLAQQIDAHGPFSGTTPAATRLAASTSQRRRSISDCGHARAPIVRTCSTARPMKRCRRTAAP